ncbi:MAG: ParB/RepB/Spo0J family partition protein [Candidatus Acidiferrales bacterium]|jgi:ParB family chromosome partitioning protein
MPRNALGKGLSALIREPEPAVAPAPPVFPTGESVQQIDIDLVDPSPFQPRTRFNESALEELSRSIQTTGIIQPLLLRRLGNRYQLIAGERRWRAAQRASLQRVPAIVREVPDDIAIEMTLVENLQREDLNPIEQATAFARLIQDFHMTQEQVAERTGKDRATIANAVRLLNLETQIQDFIEEGKITAGHGRALLAIEDSKARLDYAHRASRGGFTVRQLERLATRKPRTHSIAATAISDPNARAALEELQRKYGTRVSLKTNPNGKSGQIILEYYNDSDLARLYDLLIGSKYYTHGA